MATDVAFKGRNLKYLPRFCVSGIRITGRKILPHTIGISVFYFMLHVLCNRCIHFFPTDKVNKVTDLWRQSDF